MINPSFFADVSFRNILLQNCITDDACIQDYFESLFAEHEQMPEGYDMEIKNLTGQSPIRNINRYRIDKAMVLLKNSNRNMTEIAESVGFDNPNYFARTFRQYTGITPREYRKSGESVALGN